MSRMSEVLTRRKQQDRRALIPYITAGDPGLDATVPMMHALVGAGADIIELGVPFSDPMADGPTIQLACERALAHGTSLRQVLAMVTEFRQQDSSTPIVLMGYLKPVEAMGYEVFVAQATEAGVDGVLMVDLPPEEADGIDHLFTDAGLDMIYLIAPTTTDERIATIGQRGSGYVYYVSLKGVTGSAALDIDDVATNLQRIRRYVDVPVGVGFGIRDGPPTATLAAAAAAVIVARATATLICEHARPPQHVRQPEAEAAT